MENKMNIFKKIYCRCFQFAFRVVIPFLPYREPKILSGQAEILTVLKDKKITNAMLVTDSGLRSIGATKDLEKTLKEGGISLSVYDKTRANPTVDNVEEARTQYIEDGCKCLIAFGGGSSMDCAKAVGARLARPKKSVNQLKGTLKIRKKIPLLIAIPTTAGTGSEVTLAAVITDAKTHHKYPMNDFALIPDYAVLDASVTLSLPPHLTSTTGMDALTHAVEAFIGHSTTKNTRKMSLTATKLIFENVEKAYLDGSDTEARENMLKAAYYAGVAFTKSYVGYVHAVAHSLGGQYNVPHGFANAVLLPYVLDEYGKTAHKKLKKLAIAAGVAEEGEDNKVAAEKFITAVRSLNARMSIPDKIKGIDEGDIELMARHADKEGNPLYPVPKLMNAKQLEKFYYMVKE